MTETQPNAKDEQPKKKPKAVSLLLGGMALAGVAVAALVGTNAVGTPSRTKSDRVIGMSSIDAGLLQSDTASMIVPLTYGDGKIDLLYAGAPECSHCQAFMQKEFSALIAFAEEQELDLAYMPMAMSGLGVAIAAVEKCALPGATALAPDIVRAAYGSVSKIEVAAREAGNAIKAGGTPEEADEILTSAMRALHAEIAPDMEFDSTCYHQNAGTVGARMGAFSETFGLTGTPSFYFSVPEGPVLRMVGKPDLETILMSGKNRH